MSFDAAACFVCAYIKNISLDVGSHSSLVVLYLQNFVGCRIIEEVCYYLHHNILDFFAWLPDLLMRQYWCCPLLLCSTLV